MWDRQRERETWFRHGPISTMHHNQAIIVIELNRFSFSIEWAQFRDQSITYNTEQQQQRETSLRTENHLAASFFLSFMNHLPWFYWVYNMKNSSFCHIRHRRLQQWRHRFRRRSEEEAKNSTAEYKRVMKTTKRETIRNVTPLSGYINRPIHRSLGLKFSFFFIHVKLEKLCELWNVIRLHSAILAIWFPSLKGPIVGSLK